MSHVGRHRALTVIDELLTSNFTVVRVSEDAERGALSIIRRYQDKSFSYTNATSFAVMERLGIRTAFTFDRHFAQYGFVVLGREG